MPGDVVSGLSRLMFRGMDKSRHREAFDIGVPTGSDFAGIARILPEAEHARADAAIAANWSPAMKVFERTLEKSSSAFGIPIVRSH